MKVFALGNNGFISREMGAALGLRSHVRQARVLIAAPTKVVARAMASDWLGIGVSMSDPDFRQAMGNDLDALLHAGLLTTPSAYVLTTRGRAGSPVLRVHPDGGWSTAGTLEHMPGTFNDLRFIPAG